MLVNGVTKYRNATFRILFILVVMFSIPLLTLLAVSFVVWRILARFKKKTKTELELEKSLEEETIYVEGHGEISPEELGEEVADPDALKKKSDEKERKKT